VVPLFFLLSQALFAEVFTVLLHKSLGKFLLCLYDCLYSLLFLDLGVELLVGAVQDAQDVKVLLVQENSFPLQVIVNLLFLCPHGLCFPVYLLKHNLDEVHLAL
jgi:hypothetical protein